ncbi:unnamed protein product (macronuclear) [Paramecium tetraurelia]|uniref:Uncharacterized protein n=1 Tax=Paramecium tetraurelia TaxID=5888 RepID=A0DEP2_PARTE|nr:uncharacterized protein GSPATT00016335001 [Paramecium tetraurelia]CAK81509.1 unnamed protein product [Paramecium tetraurelia]|eukprot:XP_001448906.1 hypothetical protein (macronuclear) [Paramecium tetraurelia strain d4-2]
MKNKNNLDQNYKDKFKKDNQRIEQQITKSLQLQKKQLKLIEILKRQ